MTHRRTIALVASIAVLVGFGHLPYGYYQLLRFLVCALSLYLLFGDASIQVLWQRWLTGAFVVLYNPIIPVHLRDKGIWMVVNVLTVAWFWFLASQPLGRKGA